MGSEVGRLSNWSRTGVVGIFYFQPTLYFSKGKFSLDKYQCVPVYRQIIYRGNIIILLWTNSEWRNGKRFGVIIGTAIWFQGNFNLRRSPDHHFPVWERENYCRYIEDSFPGIGRDACALRLCGNLQESCEACRQTKTHAIALEIVGDHCHSVRKQMFTFWVKT